MQIKKRPQQETLHNEPHPKQDFQVERIAFFSDAVFAIAITLLIIEFHPPHVTKETTYAELWHELVDMKFKLLALIISFVLIVSYWMRHHLLFKRIHDYNRHIVVANMAILLPIIFFPFTTSFLYESLNGHYNIIGIPFRLFFINNILAGLLMYYFYRVVKKYKHMVYPMKRKDQLSFESNLLLMTLGFVLVFILSYISLDLSYLGILPFVVMRLYRQITNKNKKTIPPHAEQTGGPGH